MPADCPTRRHAALLGVHCASHAALAVVGIGAQWWRRDDDATSPAPGLCVPASGLAPGGEGGRGGRREVGRREGGGREGRREGEEGGREGEEGGKNEGREGREGGKKGEVFLNQLYSRCKSVSSSPPPVEMPSGAHVSPEEGFAESPPCHAQLLSSGSAGALFHALSAVAGVPSSVPPASASVVHLRGSGSHPVAVHTFMCMHFSDDSALLYHAITYRTPAKIHTNKPHSARSSVYYTLGEVQLHVWRIAYPLVHDFGTPVVCLLLGEKLFHVSILFLLHPLQKFPLLSRLLFHLGGWTLDEHLANNISLSSSIPLLSPFSLSLSSSSFSLSFSLPLPPPLPLPLLSPSPSPAPSPSPIPSAPFLLCFWISVSPVLYHMWTLVDPALSPAF